MNVNPYQKYQQNQVGTASPGSLLIMLFNGALRFVALAREGTAERDIQKANNYIVRVQDIVFELIASLDLEQGELAENLYLLYDYLNSRLIEANIKKDEKILLEVEDLLREMRDTWQEVVAGKREQPGERETGEREMAAYRKA